MPININDLMPLIIALITAIIAVYKYMMENREKNAIIDVYTNPEKAASMPEVVCKLPPRSYLMTPGTKAWITHGETPEDQATILAQVAAAEANGVMKYTIQYSKGYYHIEYGLMSGESARYE